MCSQADSLASRSVSQAKEKARTITATYGQRCCERLERFNHVGSWVKMFSALLIGRTEWYSSRCNLIWRMRGMKSNRILFQLVPSMRPIVETECGLLPTVGMLKTPSAMDSRESLATAKKNPTSGNSGCLAQEIANGYATKRGLLLPTVVTQGLKYCNEKGQSAFVNPQFLPTPRAMDGGERPKPRRTEQRNILLPNQPQGREVRSESIGCVSERIITDCKSPRLSPRSTRQSQEQFRRGDSRDIWRWDFSKFPTQSPVCGGDDGLSDRLDACPVPEWLKVNKRWRFSGWWRRGSIKAYGNAVVPQIPYLIFEAITQYDLITE